MNTQTRTTGDASGISREKLVSFVGQIFGGGSVGREDDEHPLPPGPWDPIIRKVATQVFGPHTEPWRLALGQPVPWHSTFNRGGTSHSEADVRQMILGIIAARHPEIFDVIGGDRFTRAALNPQPLPPRAVFLVAFTEEVIDRALLMQEVADAMNRPGERQGIIIVGGKLSLLVDELCGNNFKIRIPIPRPKHDTDDRLSGLELIVAGAVFEQNAATVAHEGLRRELGNAAAKLIEAGMARM